MLASVAEREAQARGPKLRAVAVNLTIDAGTGQVVIALREAGVPCLLLRGPVIARRLYQRGEIRPYEDSDLLVRLHDVNVAEAVVAGLGLVRDDAKERVLPQWERHAHSWRQPDRDFELELHWTLTHIGADPDTLWEVCSRGANTMSIGGVDVRTPADPQLGLILALHAAQHGGDWSRPQEDLRRAVELFPPAVWRTAAELAAELQARPAFSVGLRLIPSGAAVATALALPDERSFEVSLSAGQAGKGSRDFDRFVRAPGVFAKARVALDTAFPSPDRMRATRRVAARGRAGLVLAYAMQPVRAVWKFGSSLRSWRRTRRETSDRDRCA